VLVKSTLFNRLEWVALAPRLVIFGPPTVILIRRLYEAAFDLASSDRPLHAMQFDSFQLLAWGVAFYLLRRLKPARDPRRTDVVAAIIVCLVGALNAAVGLAGLTLFLLVMAGGDIRWRAVATVFGALFAQQAIVPSLFALIGPVLTQFDAMLVGSSVKLTIAGAAWQGNIIAIPSGHAIEIAPQCCSFHNVSLAVLCWVALTKLERPEWRPLDLLVLGAAVSCQVVLNTVRIYFMALSLEQYLYWHDGPGAHIFAACASVAAVLISAYGARLVSYSDINGRLAASPI
jgi:exosortase/archaeosortase family protein